MRETQTACVTRFTTLASFRPDSAVCPTERHRSSAERYPVSATAVSAPYY